MLHDNAVETIDATTNNAKFYIGEMQKPNVILKPSLSRTRMTSKELKLEQRKIRNPRMSARLEHDVEPPEHNIQGKQDQEFKVDDFSA